MQKTSLVAAVLATLVFMAIAAVNAFPGAAHALLPFLKEMLGQDLGLFVSAAAAFVFVLGCLGALHAKPQQTVPESPYSETEIPASIRRILEEEERRAAEKANVVPFPRPRR